MKGSRNGISVLSERERGVLKLASQGLTDIQICRDLAIAPGTLATYWNRIRVKTGLSSRPELTAAYERHRFESVFVRMAESVAEIVTQSQEQPVLEAAAFQSLPIAALIAGLDGRILATNKLASRLLPLDPRSPGSVLDLVSSLDRSFVRDALTSVVESEGHICFQTRTNVWSEAVECHWIAKRVRSETDMVLLLVSSPIPFPERVAN